MIGLSANLQISFDSKLLNVSVDSRSIGRVLDIAFPVENPAGLLNAIPIENFPS